MTTLGPLVPADETFHHQITDTFATVAQSRPVVDREGVRDGGADGRLGPARVRHGQVPEPRRARRVRRRVSRDASSGRCAPVARLRARRRAPRDRPDPLRGARAAAAPCASALDAERRACRSASSGRSPARCRAALEQPEHHRSRDGLRLDADIVRYHQIGTATGWVGGRRRARSSSTTRRRCRPATTRGACATWWARRSTTSRTRPGPSACRPR